MVGDENNPQRKRRKTETKKKGERGILVKELKFAKFTVL